MTSSAHQKWFAVKLIAQLIEGGSLTRNDYTEVLNIIDLKMKKKKSDCGFHLNGKYLILQINV